MTSLDRPPLQLRPLLPFLPLLVWTWWLCSCGPTDPQGARSVGDASRRAAEETPFPFEDLRQRDDVLINLELSYNQKNFGEFVRFVDEDFVFWFSAADVANGQVPVSQWDRAAEFVATMNLFYLNPPTGIKTISAALPTPGPAAPPQDATWGRIKYLFRDGMVDSATGLTLTLTYPPGEAMWVQVIPPAPYTGETWYEKTVDYSVSVSTPDITFIQGGPVRAGLVVRFTEFQGDSIWQVIAWRDDI